MAHPTSRSLLVLLFTLGACADDPYEGPAYVCANAEDALAECGRATDGSPFGTCQPDQAELAQQVLDVYDSEGCAGLSDAKADSWTCSLLPFLCVQHSVTELAPFTTDGCTMFPDGTLSDATRWQHCCIEHDFAYYAGGPREAKDAADRALRACVAQAANDSLGLLMYQGVLVGGTPSLPTPWRWGYGWAYDPLDGYRDLSPAEAAATAANIAAYRANPTAPKALEQRLRELADDIARVPALQRAMDLVTSAVQQLE